jgi:hypothetical protein
MKRIYLFTIVAIIALTGCEGKTEYYTEFYNLSTSTIVVTSSNMTYGDTTKYTIPPGSKESILQLSKLGGISTNGNCNSWFYDAKITKVNGEPCQKDLMNENNWISMTQEERKLPGIYKHTCQFIILESDF